MQAIDSRLKALALKAQKHPPKSTARKIALAQLLSELQRSGKMTRPFRGLFRGMYQDIYSEAIQKLFTHICEKIDDYDPNREVLQWVNFLLGRRFFIEASREIFPHYRGGKKRESKPWMTIDDLEIKHPRWVQSQTTPSLSEEFQSCLLEDPEGLFQNTHVEDRPEANFQFLIQQRLAGYKWKEISEDLGIPLPTLHSFYRRNLREFAPKFRDYLAS
ncbi:MAG: sigma-70 family RNA polymerase sigma factor [Cyanobacteria bacterium P01_E01_bin.42]